MATANESVKEFFEREILDARQTISSLSNWKDYDIFTFLCAKYYFYWDSEESTSDDEIIASITDGANDGSIDAICADPNNENALILAQSKFTKIDQTTFIGEISEMIETCDYLEQEHFEKYNDIIRDRFTSEKDKIESTTMYKRFVYFTLDTPQEKKQKELREKIRKMKMDRYSSRKDIISIEVFFGSEIQSYIEGCKEQKAYVEFGTLDLDKKDNALHYNDSVLVNIKAKSLKSLYQRKQRSLLGMNLRFHVKTNPGVDKGIGNTIKYHPERFWYLNNGLVIACDDYEIDGTKLKLSKFSIINGGQTTDRVRDLDFDDDFLIPCKVIKLNIETDNDKELNTAEIAIATNSQKPIKPKDLVANDSVQHKLQGAFKKIQIQYIIKNGETVGKEFKDSSKHTNIDSIGKIALAGVMQYPSSRSDAKILYDKEKDVYGKVYANTSVNVLADLLRIDNCYKSFINSAEAKRTQNQIITKNARTTALAAVCFLSLITQKPDLKLNVQAINEEDDDNLRQISDEIRKLNSLMPVKKDYEKELLYSLFLFIAEVTADCFDNYKETHEEAVESNYLKQKTTYPKVLKKLYQRYYGDIESRTSILFKDDGFVDIMHE